jgi:hypothetical protein
MDSVFFCLRNVFYIKRSRHEIIFTVAKHNATPAVPSKIGPSNNRKVFIRDVLCISPKLGGVVLVLEVTEECQLVGCP